MQAIRFKGLFINKKVPVFGRDFLSSKVLSLIDNDLDDLMLGI